MGIFNAAFLSTLFVTIFASAQNVNVKDIDAGKDSSTTIEIRKGDKANQPLWEVVEGKADVTGEYNADRKEARAEWSKACNSWKKEVRDDNKENKVLSLNCGKATCTPETEGTVCKSEANYRIKTRIN